MYGNFCLRHGAHLSCRRNILPSIISTQPLISRTSIASSRNFSFTFPRLQSNSTNQLTDIPSRWLSDLRSRVGRCIMFGLKKDQINRAGEILDEVARDWRELLAGSEGFLTGKGNAGLEGQNVVWGEMDSMGHVNNVTYVRYAESARVNWSLNFAKADSEHKKQWSELCTPKSQGFILKSIKTEYKFVSLARIKRFFIDDADTKKPMTWPDKISVYHKFREAPSGSTDSFVLDVVILSDKFQRPAARCVEEIVMYDYTKGEKSTLEPFMAAKFIETFEKQEESKRRNAKRILGLLDRVRRLEKETWDRSDAKEDFGPGTA